MVGVAENDLGSDRFFQLVLVYGFDAARRPNRHKDRGGDRPVRRLYGSRPCGRTGIAMVYGKFKQSSNSFRSKADMVLRGCTGAGRVLA